jgi:lysophospholipase L1-like esterase
VLGTLVFPASAAIPSPDIYVALGDSYTAGPLIPNPKGRPPDCGRSDHNYPTLVADEIDPRHFRDVSCGSAQTEHMTHPQTELPLGGTNRPQFGALGPNVDLVTLGIGGNDMGFGDIVNKCAELGIRNNGRGKPCTRHYREDGVNRIARRLREVVGPRLARVINGIQSRSPNVRLLVVGYPDPVPQRPGCYPTVPLARGDLPFLHGVARRLSETVENRADAGGAEYVELRRGSIGHDICQPPRRKWYEGIAPTSPAYPAHPNARGMEFAARQVLRVLRR